MTQIIIRNEKTEDTQAIDVLTQLAFKGVEHSLQTESAIIDVLRNEGALTISLVAELQGNIVGHIAFSPVLINAQQGHWYGLGPVSVHPHLHNQGIGTALIKEGLKRLKQHHAHGCVVLGSPVYYRKFGFTSHHMLRYGTVPPEYFQSLLLSGQPQAGEVTYHAAFDIGS